MSPCCRNVSMLALISILQSLWATAVLAWVLTYFPKTSPMSFQVLNEWRSLVKPEWDTELYHFFIFCACLVFVMLVYCWRQHLAQRDLWQSLGAFFIIECTLIFLAYGVAFKFLVFPQPSVDRISVLLFLLLSVICKFFFMFKGKYK